MDAWLYPLFWGPCLLVWIFWFIIILQDLWVWNKVCVIWVYYDHNYLNNMVLNLTSFSCWSDNLYLLKWIKKKTKKNLKCINIKRIRLEMSTFQSSRLKECLGTYFLISPSKHMLWVLTRTSRNVLVACFHFPRTYLLKELRRCGTCKNYNSRSHSYLVICPDSI